MKIEASAPSNIALIKYMGKTPGNRPANPSLSYTLEHLRSFVTIEPIAGERDEWRPLSGYQPISLSEKGLGKFLNHFARLKDHWRVLGAYRISSANNFPSDCGLASSASSFAALTEATYALAKATHPGLEVSNEELSVLSRQGSGSSCRSFFSPWAEWEDEGARALDLDLRLEHAVIVVDERVKEVSSSNAHELVNTSPNWVGRTSRAKERLEKLKVALRDGDWRMAFEICWDEFLDMHSLFETATPAFSYLNGGSKEVLIKLREIWGRDGDGPLITMDAGANVHILIRPDQIRAAEQWLDGFKVIKSWGE